MRRAALPVLAMVLGAVSGVRADPVTPYTDPLFAAQCTFHHFAEGEAPPPGGLPDDPLCVEYDKRDITATDGGAIRFLAAEPARFAVAVPKCRYWQQDHWSVPSTGTAATGSTRATARARRGCGTSPSATSQPDPTRRPT